MAVFGKDCCLPVRVLIDPGSTNPFITADVFIPVISHLICSAIIGPDVFSQYDSHK